MPYAVISASLGIPVGSIGPSRARCLDKLRRYPAIAALINAEAGSAASEQSRQTTAHQDHSQVNAELRGLHPDRARSIV